MSNEIRLLDESHTVITNVSYQHVSPEFAKAQSEVAEKRFAVPARWEAISRISTALIVGAVVLLALWWFGDVLASGDKASIKAARDVLMSLFGVVAAGGAVAMVVKYLKK